MAKPPKVFETEHTLVSIDELDADITSHLNDGWELVSALFTVANPTQLDDTSRTLLCIFKREVKD
jgi:hypothetical protein